MHRILDHFDALLEFGLKVIPLRQDSKIPLCKGWTDNWNKNTARSKLTEFPHSNIGVLLGEIVDVEGDSIEANRHIEELIGSYPHPSYQSTRSTHHLFVNPSNLRIFKHKKIEFRGWGHQSVLPPSRHEGVSYRWINTDAFPVPPMPEKLRAFLGEKTLNKKKQNGCVNAVCKTCDQPMVMHRKRLKSEIESLSRLGINQWICRNCRDIDLRPHCRAIKVSLRRNK